MEISVVRIVLIIKIVEGVVGQGHCGYIMI